MGYRQKNRKGFSSLTIGRAGPPTICRSRSWTRYLQADSDGSWGKDMGRKSGGPRQQIHLHTARHKAKGNKVRLLEI